MKATVFKLFSEALFPADITCCSCGAELISETRYGFCASCTKNMPFVSGKVCECCGVPMANEADYCINCMNYGRKFSRNRSALEYEGLSLRLIYAFKFGGKKYLAEELSKMLCDTYLNNSYSADVIEFVPMSERERRARGYNQAELLGVETGKRLNLPVGGALKKIRDTGEQKELKGRARKENLKGVFSVADNSVIAGKRVLLIDDVFTTGATANECASVLKKAGAREVLVLTVCITKYKLYGETAQEL